MDMRSPGLDVRPIKQATGESHFCEVFLNDVVIPADNLIGAENSGWQVAQETLMKSNMPLYFSLRNFRFRPRRPSTACGLSSTFARGVCRCGSRYPAALARPR